MHLTRYSRNRGQTLVLFLGFVAATVGMMLIVFNSGQVTNAKMKAMNAADAAAYSGALWEARSLNFQAYMNRAMVVNEVTIAQSVSLRSWLAYVDQFVTNVNTITQFIPYLGAATTQVRQVIHGIDNAAQSALPMADMFMRAVNVAEHGAQMGFYGSGSFIAQDLARQVAQANGAVMSPGGNTLMGLNTQKWLAFTKPYENNQRTRIRNVTLDSRDGFSQARDRMFGGAPFFEIRKQGGTDLINYDSWKGLDSAELRTVWVFGKWKSKVPMAWGGAQSYSPSKKTGIGTHGNINEWGHTDGNLARAEANGSKAKNIAAPFQGYYDISNPQVKNANLQLPFSVEVMIAGTGNPGIPTAKSAAGATATQLNGAQIDHDPNYAGGRGVYAMAESCVRFARPYRQNRADGAREYPSLFNPYWTASLATESKAARIIADGAKGLLPPLSMFFANDTCS